MESNLNRHFCEMTQGEVMETDGGMIFGPAMLGCAIGYLVAKDLSNCYRNGYNEVMSSHK